MKTKALFLFAGLGGYAYPFYQSGEYDITFVENNENIITHLQKQYPGAKVICGDAIEFLEENHKDFGLIYASPPCVANSRLNALVNREILPSLLLYEIKIFLDYYGNADYVIENTIPYYYNIIKDYFNFPYSKVGRHFVLSNFEIKTNLKLGSNKSVLVYHKGRKQSRSTKTLCEYAKLRPELSEIDFSKIKHRRREQLYNNTMELDVSTYIFEQYEKGNCSENV